MYHIVWAWLGARMCQSDVVAAYAEAGRFADAVAEQQRLIEMLRAGGRDDEVADFRARLDSYCSGKPYRE